MTTNARIGYGSILSMWSFATSPPAFVALDEVKSFTPPSETTDVLDATHMASPNGFREFTLGLSDGGEFSAELNFVPGNASDDLIRANLAYSRTNNVPIPMRIQFANDTLYDFDAYITGWEPNAPIDDLMTATLTMKVTSIIDVGVVT